MKRLMAACFICIAGAAWADDGSQPSAPGFRNDDDAFVQRFKSNEGALEAAAFFIRCKKAPKLTLNSVYHLEVGDLITGAIQAYGDGGTAENISQRGEDMLYVALNRLRKNDELLRLQIDAGEEPPHDQCSDLPLKAIDTITSSARAGN